MSEEETQQACGGCVTLLVINAIFGWMSLNYVLATTIGASISSGWSFFIGLLFGGWTIPMAIFCWLLRYAGIEAPFMQ